MTCANGHNSPRYKPTGGAAAECVECRRAKNKRAYRYTPDQRPQSMVDAARRRAKEENLPFNLKRSDVLSIWPRDNCCPIFHAAFVIGKGRGKALPESATLDRIRPELGYVPGNVAVISMRANRIKQAESDPAMIRRVADWMQSATR